MHERRRSNRQKSFLRGCVYSRSRTISASCIIRNISPEGARIVLSAALNIPEELELEIPDKMRNMPARVRWRRGDELGLAFCDADLTVAAPRVSELGERIGRLETEIAALRRLYEQAKGHLTAVPTSQGH